MTKTLLELARKATPGPWLAASSPSSVVGWPIVAPADMGRSICNVTYVQHSKIDLPVAGDRAFNNQSRANAAFIAAANPKRIIELCEALEETLDELEATTTAEWPVPLGKQKAIARARATLKGE